MEIITTIIAFIILIGVIVFIHEGGHYLGARVSNIKVLEFSIGFGKKIFSKKIGKDKTLFTIRILPLGGFVKPLDSRTISEEVWAETPEKDKKRALTQVSKGKQMLMVFAGPAANFILAIILFFGAYSFVGTKELPPTVSETVSGGLISETAIKSGDIITQINEKPISTYSEAYTTIANSLISGDKVSIVTDDNKLHEVDFSKIKLKDLGDDISKTTGVIFEGLKGDIVVTNLDKGGIAEKNGIKIGDQITEVNGYQIQDLTKLLRIIKNSPNIATKLKIKRDQEDINLILTPKGEIKNGNTIGKINIELTVKNPINTIDIKLSTIEGLSYAINKTYQTTKVTILSIYRMAIGDISTKNISGPLTIADYSGKSFNKGLFTYLILMGTISIAVGVFNLLPIPILDGGHLMIYIIEILKKKDFTIRQLNKIQFIGILAMIGFFTIAIANDLTKYVGL